MRWFCTSAEAVAQIPTETACSNVGFAARIEFFPFR